MSEQPDTSQSHTRDNSWNQRRRDLSRVLHFLWELGPREVVLIGSVTVFNGLVPILTLFCLRGAVDSAVGLIGETVTLQHAGVWLGALMATSFLSWALPPVQIWVSHSVQERLRARAQERLLQKAYRLSLEDFERPAHYDRLHRAREGLDDHLIQIMEFLFPIPSYLVTATGLLLYLGATSVWLPLVLLAGIVPTQAVAGHFMRKRYLLRLSHTPAQRRLDYLGDLMLRRDAAAEIRLFGLQKYLLDKRQKLFFGMRKDRLRLEVELMRSITAGAVGDQFAYGMVMAGVVALVARGSLSVGYYAAYLGAAERFRDAVSLALFGIQNLDHTLLYVKDLLDYLDLKEETGDRARRPLSPSPPHSIPAIRFESVSFTYPGSETPVLDRVDFTLEPGERIALVGENGAGKTTLARLLLGLYRPTEGRIAIDGSDLAEIDPRTWRERMGAVFQDYVRYEVTARENIGFGDLTHLRDDTAIRGAAAKSGANEVVSALPGGYGTVLGKAYDEEGQDLSTGQWQKLAIARAYLRNAWVLVLDEPTAALDAKAEVEVYRQFRDMSEGRSVFLISHRLGSARLADRILFLENGRIAECGTHGDLLRKGGRYAQMYSIQAGWYA